MQYSSASFTPQELVSTHNPFLPPSDVPRPVPLQANVQAPAFSPASHQSFVPSESQNLYHPGQQQQEY